MEYFAFQWHITEACDQRCRHCYIYALGSHAKFQEMALEDMVTVLENCKTFCQKAGRLPYLYITGGDPILHPQFWALMKLLKLSNIPFALMGNPFHLTADVCRRLKDYGCRKYQLSLDGLRETHDGIRQQPGSYDATMAAIPLLRDAGIDVAIMTTVSRWNYRDIPALVDEVVKNKADIFAFARYCPSQEDRDVCCSPAEYRDMMEQCWEKFQKYRAQGCGTTFNLKDHLWTLFLYEKGLFDPKAYPEDEYVYEGCNCGNCHLTILSDGAVYACRRMESKVGNALTDDLYDLFTGPKLDQYRVYEKFEKCSKCELLRFCRGCPAVAAGYHGDMYAPDPECWKPSGGGAPSASTRTGKSPGRIWRKSWRPAPSPPTRAAANEPFWWASTTGNLPAGWAGRTWPSSTAAGWRETSSPRSSPAPSTTPPFKTGFTARPRSALSLARRTSSTACRTPFAARSTWSWPPMSWGFPPASSPGRRRPSKAPRAPISWRSGASPATTRPGALWLWAM